VNSLRFTGRVAALLRRSAVSHDANQNRAASVIGDMQRIATSFIVPFILAGAIHAQRSAQRIEEASFITIGGIEQWVTLRGDDRRNPVLLLLHGGPGDVQSPLVSTYAQDREVQGDAVSMNQTRDVGRPQASLAPDHHG
jgi:hypothetical protein